MFANLTLFALTFSLVLSAQSDDGKKLVTLRDFSVQGSRFSTVSVVRLAGLHTGKRVNFLLLNDALQKVVSSGLIENIDFEYENYEDKPEEVKLLMKCRDAMPIVPSRVVIDGADEEAIWKWLQNADPLFTRKLPPNERPCVSMRTGSENTWKRTANRTLRRPPLSALRPKARRATSNAWSSSA